MRADIVALIVISVYLLAYFFYSKLIANKVLCLDDSKITPAHKYQDGIDYIPARKHILFGHHFASIAGAAPIVGPCIAVYWGWVPALIWIVVGSIFMGAVHDMSVLYLSVKHKAQSIGSITGSILNKRSKLLFLILTFFLVWILSAAFAVIIARLFVNYPGTVIPINIAIILALVIGYLFYKKGFKPLVPSLIALFILYASIPVGVAYPIDLTQILGWDTSAAIAAWVIFLMIYGLVASVLPVWVLLQPRDYINSHQLIVGLGVLILGVFLTKPEIVAPAFNLEPGDSPPWFPYLFVTIACGAISGAHGLIASGTTSKQINKESDIRPIGYGSMLIEATLALLAILAATAGFADKADWQSHYHSWAYASKHGLDAFIHGAAGFLTHVGISTEIGSVFIAVIVISFAATTLDTTFRIQRFIITEIGESVDLKFTKNRYISTAIAVVTITMLIFIDGSTNVSGAFTLWPLFGTGNQLLAALSLIVLTVYLYKSSKKSKKGFKKRYLFIALPACVITVATLFSGIISAEHFYSEQNYLLTVISAIMLILQVWLTTEAINELKQA